MPSERDAGKWDPLTARLRTELAHGARVLSLRGRNDGNACAHALAQCLHETRVLKRLDCADCEMTDTGSKALVDALQHNRSVTRLDLSGNYDITNAVGQALLFSLKEGLNTTLTECELAGTSIEEPLADRIRRAAETNSFPRQLRDVLPALEADCEVAAEAGLSGIAVGEGAVLHVRLAHDDSDPQVYTVPSLERLAVAAGASAQLQELQLDRCVRHGDRAAEALSVVLRTSQSLLEFGLPGCGVGPAGASWIAEAVAENAGTVLRSINLRDNEIGDAGAAALANMLQQVDSVTSVDLSLNNVSPPLRHRVSAGCSLNSMPKTLKTCLPQLLHNDESLTVLDLAGGEGKGRQTARGYFGNVGAAIVAEALERNSAVTELKLQGNHIGPDGCGHLADMLSHNDALLSVDLSDNADIKDEGARKLLIGLSRNDSVCDLDLSGCGVTERLLDEAAAVCLLNRQPRSLKRLLPHVRLCNTCDPSITTVDFSMLHQSGHSRLIGPEGGALLQAALKGSRYVTELNLSNNTLGDDGAACIARLVKESRTLRKVNLAANGIGKDGALTLLRALRHNHSVKELELAGNRDVPLEVREEVSAALRLNEQATEVKEIVTRLSVDDKSLTNVDLAGLPRAQLINDDCLRIITDVLICNTSVTVLNLEGNLVSNRGVEYLCEWLRDGGGSLTSLSLARNDVGTDGALGLREAAVNSTQLRHLDLSDNHVLERGAAAILELVRVHGSLTEVDVTKNDAPPALQQQASQIATLNRYPAVVKPAVLGMLDDDPQYVEVDLTECVCPVTHGGITAGDSLCATLKTPITTTQHLRVLVMNACCVGDEGCKLLADATRGHPSLEELHLRRNAVGPGGADALSAAVEEASDRIRVIDLSENKVPAGNLERLSAALLLNEMPIQLKRVVPLLRADKQSLTAVELRRGGNSDEDPDPRLVGDVGAGILVGCLVGNTAVRTLDLRENGLTDAGAAKLAALVRETATLHTLHLDGNMIGAGGLQQLAAAVWENASLAEITMDGNDFDAEADPIVRGAWTHLTSKLDANAARHRPQPRGYQQRKEELEAAAVNVYRTTEYMRRMEEDIMRDALAGAPARGKAVEAD